jgi:outer membrane protein TolC
MNDVYKSIFNRPMSWPPAVLGILILAGCAAVGPDYVPPDTPVSATWHTQLKDGLSAGEMDPQTLTAWWRTLNDPELSSLIQRTVAENFDLTKARARVCEARARRGIARANLFPTLDATGSANWTYASTSSSSSISTSTSAGSQDLYAAGFDAGWEIDIFGGTRRSVEAATGDLQASEEKLRNVIVSLLAEVALNYVEVRTFQMRIVVAEANLEAQNETYQLTQWRYRGATNESWGKNSIMRERLSHYEK